MPETREQLLDLAQNLVQTRGFNGFSFQDLAAEIGIRVPSIHYHFRTKSDLGVALVERYGEYIRHTCNDIDMQHASARKRFAAFLDMFGATLERGTRLCLCGMLAAENATLPEAVVATTRRFWLEVENWLAKTLTLGRKQREFTFKGSPASVAQNAFSALQGAMTAAHAFDDRQRFTTAAKWITAQIV